MAGSLILSFCKKSACCCYCWKERQKAPRFRERNWKRTLQKGIKTPPERRTPVDEPILAASPVLVWQPVHKALFVRGKSVSRIGHHMNVQHNAAVVSRLKGQLRILAGPTNKPNPAISAISGRDKRLGAMGSIPLVHSACFSKPSTPMMMLLPRVSCPAIKPHRLTTHRCSPCVSCVFGTPRFLDSGC